VIGGHISMARPPSRARFTTSFAMLVERHFIVFSRTLVGS